MKKNYNYLVLMLGFAGFVSAADNWFVSPALPAIAKNFSVTSAIAATIITSYMAPYGLLQPVYGFFADKFSKESVLKLIITGLTIGTLLSALSPTLSILNLTRGITGFFAAGIIAVSLALIGDMVPRELAQNYVGKFMGIVFLGQGLSAGMGGLLTKYINWRASFLFFALLAFLSAIILYLKLPNRKRISIISPKGNFFKILFNIINTPKGRVIFPLAAIAGFLILGVYSYLGAYFVDKIGLDYLQSGLIIMFYGFACLLGGNIAGKIHLQKMQTIILGEILSLCTIILLYFAHSWILCIIGVMLLGFGYIFVQSTLATAAFYVSETDKGLSSGLIGTGLFTGGSLGSLFGALILSTLNFNYFLAIFGVLILILTVLTFSIKL